MESPKNIAMKSPDSITTTQKLCSRRGNVAIGMMITIAYLLSARCHLHVDCAKSDDLHKKQLKGYCWKTSQTYEYEKK